MRVNVVCSSHQSSFFFLKLITKMCINRPRLLTFRSLFFCAFQIHWLATWRWWRRLWFPPCVHCASSSEPSSSCSCCKDAFETLADFPPFDMIRPRWPWRNELGQSENESESETHTWSSELIGLVCLDVLFWINFEDSKWDIKIASIWFWNGNTVVLLIGFICNEWKQLPLKLHIYSRHGRNP